MLRIHSWKALGYARDEPRLVACIANDPYLLYYCSTLVPNLYIFNCVFLQLWIKPRFYSGIEFLPYHFMVYLPLKLESQPCFFWHSTVGLFIFDVLPHIQICSHVLLCLGSSLYLLFWFRVLSTSFSWTQWIISVPLVFFFFYSLSSCLFLLPNPTTFILLLSLFLVHWPLFHFLYINSSAHWDFVHVNTSAWNMLSFYLLLIFPLTYWYQLKQLLVENFPYIT